MLWLEKKFLKYCKITYFHEILGIVEKMLKESLTKL